MPKLALKAQTVDIAYLRAKSLLAENVLMAAQKDLGLGNSLLTID